MPELSIVIPVFNEQVKVGDDIRAAAAFFSSRGIDGEILIADDGSTDDTVHKARTMLARENFQAKIHILELAHRGKGHAVRQGILASTGKYVLFADSGSCVPFDNALRGLVWLRNGECRIAHGSRRLPDSRIVRGWSAYRRLWSDAFSFFIRRQCGLGRRLTDTQCGFKIYDGDCARRLYGQCRTEGFMFDIEVILRAGQMGMKIREFPVEWSWDPDSRLSPVQKSLQMIRELITIRKMLRNENIRNKSRG